jgi:hypothetical protein
MNKDELKEFVLANPKLVNMRSAGEGIFVLKYSKRVFYDNLWNDFLEECRGTIVDADFNVVSRPFTKIYNYGVEAKAPVLSDDTPVTAYRKVNGFMVAMTWYNNDILISTTGSTANDYVDYAKEMMVKHQPYADWQMELIAAKGMTLMFECCHPSDPHIVPEDAGMYFLGVRENTWDSKVKMYGKGMAEWARDYAMSHLKCGYAEPMQVTMGVLKDLSSKVKHEGFVFYTEDGVSAKIKSPYYLTSKWVARNPRTDKLVNMEADIKKNLDEEYYPLVDAIRANIVEYTALDEQARLSWVRNYLEVA